MVPTTAVFCDGGTLSNFPMNLFAGLSLAGVQLPTIGLQTQPDREGLTNITSPAALLHAMNNSSRHLQDREFLVQNPLYRPYIKVDASNCRLDGALSTSVSTTRSAVSPSGESEDRQTWHS